MQIILKMNFTAKNINFSYDNLGIIASTLCMIHCIGTPFLFIAKACSTTCCADAPLWWKAIDYAFLIVSFFAIYFIAKKSSNNTLIFIFWFFWGLLAVTIFNETLGLFTLPKNFIYIPAFSIIILHFYNIKFCKCDDEKSCCTQS